MNFNRATFQHLFLDLDGVVYNGKEETDPRLISALCQLNEVGIRCSVITARPLALCARAAEELPCDFFACDSGATLYSSTDKDFHRQYWLPATVVKAVFSVLKTLPSGKRIGMAAGSEYHCNSEMRSFLNDYHGIDGLSSLQASPEVVTSICIRDLSALELHQIKEVVKEVTIEVRQQDSIYSVMTLRTPGIDKGTAISEISSLLGISSSNTVMVGDSDDDHAAFMKAGFSAAPSNASDSVKQVVHFTAQAPYQAGLLEIIHHLWAEHLAIE